MIYFLKYLFQENTHEDREIHDLQHEIVIWHRTSQGLSSFSKVLLSKFLRNHLYDNSLATTLLKYLSHFS